MSHEFPQRAHDAAWRMVDGEMIVVSAGTSDILSLNATGALIWERADGQTSTTQIAEELAAEYDVDEREAAADVEAFIEALETQGLLARVTAGARP